VLLQKNCAGANTAHCAISTTVVKVKVKLTLEQAMKAQRKSRGIALLFL
jgi:hypothetical protein